MSGSDLEDIDLQPLYRAPLEGFIAARDAVVKDLRASGHAREASSVKALRKPSLPAWAVNQLASRHPDQVRSLLDAGAEMRAAQQAALSSERNADRLRKATAARRRAISDLAALAADILLETGRSPTSQMADIRSTLEAASVDPETARRLREGTLDRTVREPAGFGDVFGLKSVTGGLGSRSPTDDIGAAGESQGEEASAAELSRSRRAHDIAVRNRSRAREAADLLSAQVAAAEARLEDLRSKLSRAEAGAREAELDAKRIEATIRRADE